VPQTRHVLRDRLQRHGLLLDVLLGTALAVVNVLSLWSEPTYVTLDFAEPDALAVVLAVLAGAAVGLRRRWPEAALVLTAVPALTLLQLGHHQALGGIPVLLTLYSVAVARPARTSGTALVLVGGAVALVLLTGPFPADLTDWLANGFIIVAGWALGRSVRSRRAYAAGLEERNRALLAARESQTRAALVDERSRLAREMQDLVAHSLTAMTVQAAAARRVVRADPDAAEQALAEVERAGRDALVEMRRILGVLRPEPGTAERRPQPGVGDLADLVAQAVDEGLEVTLTSHGRPVEVEPGVQLAAYRVVQDALARARRRPGRPRIQVALTWHDGTLSVAVEEDGSGPPVRDDGAPLPSPAGDADDLSAVRERVHAYGGQVSSGSGFAVTATFPSAGDPQ
jgi:signal transduction histidine kinase